jgi:hypothetical protein
VLVLDPVPSRASLAAAQGRGRQITVLPLGEADIAVKDGVFDVALITDLSALPEPGPILAQIRRSLSARGTAIVATPNPEARLHLLPPPGSEAQSTSLGYYELYDLVAAEFSEVRMLGQTPFVGYAVVDFAPEGEPSVALDSGLVPGGAEEPEWFVAVGGREPEQLDELSIVQLPLSRALGDRAAVRAPGVRAPDPRLEARVQELEAALEDARTSHGKALREGVERARQEAREEARQEGARELAKLSAALGAEQERATAAVADAAALRERSAASDERLRRVEAEASTLRAQAAAVTERARSTRDETTALEGRLKAAEAALDRARAEAALAASELERRRAAEGDLKRQVDALTSEQGALVDRAAQAEAEVGRLRAELTEARRERELEAARALALAGQGDAPDDLARLEAALSERAARIRQLEDQLREAERVGKGLLREVAQGAASLRGRPADPVLGSVSAENARLRADLEALGWTVAELERRLSGGPAPAADATS